MRHEYGTCFSCGIPLLQPNGFHGTELCGPCCVGESAMIGKVSIQCTHFGCCNVQEETAREDHKAIHWTRACSEHRVKQKESP